MRTASIFRSSRCKLRSYSLLSILVAATTLGQTIAEEVTVGAWNIEWLGYPEMRARPGKDLAQKPADLAEWINKSSVKVLALEEIGVESTETRRSDELDATFKILKDKYQQDWTYVLFAKTNYEGQELEDFTIRGQHIGLAWRTDVAKQVGEPYTVEIPPSETFGYKFWERRANGLKLSFGDGKTDVVFFPVHLKSNRNENKDDKDWTKKHRAAEAKAFIEQLSTIKSHFRDEDIVLLGDFNFLADDDEGPTIFKEGGFIDLNDSDEGTTANWGEGYTSAPFDRIMVPKNQTEFVKSKQTVLRDGASDDEIRGYRRKYSDHYMVVTEIEIGKDDD